MSDNSLRLIPFIITTLLLLFSQVGYAQSEQDKSLSIDQENIDTLITTLESKTAREEFVSNLKTLQQVQENETSDFSLSERLHLNEASSEVIDKYTSSLNAIGISDSLIGNSLISLLAAIFLVILAWLNSKLAISLNKRLSPLRHRLHLSKDRFSPVFKLQIILGRLFALILFVYTIYSVFPFWKSTLGIVINLEIAVQIILTLVLISLLATTLWEFSNAILEFLAKKSGRFTDSRVETLLPVIRNILLTVFFVIFALVFLSEVGIDITPFLASAGVIGVALGFGAQALVKDFLTGILVVFEDIFQVGDVVKISDRTGLVERITLRKVQLRDLDGTVHTIPFSEVAVIDNFTKIFSYYLFDIGVAYREDVDEVIACLKKIDQEMQEDEDYGKHMLEPLEILGVDRFADSAVMIKARTKTTPMEKWYVGREFNRRMKIHFDSNNIEIPFPHQTVYFGEDKEGDAPSAKLTITSKDTEQPSAHNHD